MNATFVLQKEILEELYVREDEFKSFLSFLKSHFRDYTLITDFVDESDFISSAEENPLLELLVDKFTNIEYISDLASYFEDEKFKTLFSQRTIVLSAVNDEICNEYLNAKGVLFFNLGLLKNWEIYSDIILSKSLKVTKDSSIPRDLRFVDFQDLCRFFKYCNSLIIFDRYVFGDKSNQKLVHNLYILIENILTVIPNAELMIISEFKGDEIVKNYNLLNNHLKSKGLLGYSLKLIHHSKAFYPRKFEGLHSRFILSNYIHIISHDSFNFFKEDGSFNNLTDIDIKFNLTNQNNYSYVKDLATVKTYLSKIKNEPNCGNPELKVTYCKDKFSALIA
ncbi:hypothetical protein PQ465_20580 [Sphingobacterium oryzagri]|uniref:Uncharacterized protein n=1 Tax=Sphingobacterium oryzagri TaxID=3025669 RepID=A0ABY7WHM5_9SPHI|nr:hypothetical protein [Sphingobacterium sp. KACC 22765]WDF68678.1 hypothetical protein PQ465_20580 [Sphingobacterium sp. KACC 22765]